MSMYSNSKLKILLQVPIIGKVGYESITSEKGKEYIKI